MTQRDMTLHHGVLWDAAAQAYLQEVHRLSSVLQFDTEDKRR